MFSKKIVKIVFILLTITIAFFLFYSLLFKNKKIEVVEERKDETAYSSNILKDVKYTTKDADGNEYIITAQQGEIDFKDPNILYLTKVNAIIKLKNSEIIDIVSDYGKYNSENFDTIFSKNVILNYLDNKINGEYLDFSLGRNSIMISKNVVYNNLNNTLKADVMELNLKTKDTKIFMYEKEKKVNIKSKN